MKTLILTGWGIDYACSAAIAAIKFPDSEIYGMSKSRLPEYLSELSSSSNALYDRIIIIGISLVSQPQSILQSLRKLKRKNTRIQWISCYPVPSGIFSEDISGLLDIFCPNDPHKYLFEIVGESLGVSSNESSYKGIGRILKLPRKSLTSADLAQISLIESAASRYRRFQDWKPYSEAIRTVSRRLSFTERQVKMIEEFKKFGHREFKGRSKAVEKIWDISKKLGIEGKCRVLITGETGTGKETVANLIHGHSERAGEPFIAFNCADLSPHLLESRLFGHEKGAFTGAEKKRLGAFELANGGTLFLDEVGELPLAAQAGLLRVIQEGRFFRLGGEEEIAVDVRIIAATNRSLPEMVSKGEFREDLFYRLNVIHIHIPPLRERPEDIEVIANDYMLKRTGKRLSSTQIDALKSYSWPGNVREMENILERALVLGSPDFVQILSEHRSSLAFDTKQQSDMLSDVIRVHVRKSLDKFEGNKSRTANALGISLNTLKKYMK